MNLQLSLKRQWFEMTKAGVKTEDYRELSVYWFKRLVYRYKDVLLYNGFTHGFTSEDQVINFATNHRTSGQFGFKPFTTNTMTLGYPSKDDTDRIIKFEHAGIEIRTGNPDWGAEEGKIYFVIKHGKKQE